MKDVYILGIETSCDETSISIVKNGRDVVSNVISSQIDIHKLYGGVVPEIASRKHIENMQYVFNEAFKNTNLSMNDMDAVAVTYGPGLVGALLVGLSFAKGLSMSYDKPFIGVNHIEGHICSNYISNKELEPPFIALIISGGHTNLVHVIDYYNYKIYGRTMDDAVGECFDKIARNLGFEYPGGAKIEKASHDGKNGIFNFPRGVVRDSEYDFTFSGLKSHVLNVINVLKKQNSCLDKKVIANISLELQNSIIDSLVYRTISLSKKINIDKVAVCGGVSANDCIKKALENELEKNNIKFYYPEKIYSTDNGAMIASSGYYHYLKKEFSNLDLNAKPDLEFS